MTEIRLVAIDIDGTLVDHQGKMINANKVAVTAAVEAGIMIVLLTARRYFTAIKFAAELGLQTSIVTNNGALARRIHKDEDLWHLRNPFEAARAIAGFADERGYELSTTIGDLTYVRRRPGGDLGPIGNGVFVLESNVAALNTGPTSIHATGHETVVALLEAFGDGLGDEVAFRTFSRGAEFDSMMMTHVQANKGWGLKELCRTLNISAKQTPAIGDSEADIDMLDVAGMSVAVGDAKLDVQRMAQLIGPPLKDGAVAWALNSLML